MNLLEVVEEIYRDSLMDIEKNTVEGISSKELSLKIEGAYTIFTKMKRFINSMGITDEYDFDERFININ